MRCFAAAFLTGESARALQRLFGERLIGDLGSADLRRVPQQNLHVTVKFFGAVPASAVAALMAAVADLDGRALEVAVTGFSGLPRPQAAQVVVADLAADARLEGWWRTLEQRFGSDGRDFRPHVTLARCRRPCAVAALPLAAPLCVALTAPALYRSDATPDGSRYRVVTAADLAAPDRGAD